LTVFAGDSESANTLTPFAMQSTLAGKPAAEQLLKNSDTEATLVVRRPDAAETVAIAPVVVHETPFAVLEKVNSDVPAVADQVPVALDVHPVAEAPEAADANAETTITPKIRTFNNLRDIHPFLRSPQDPAR
jgi:hypothetical protein